MGTDSRIGKIKNLTSRKNTRLGEEVKIRENKRDDGIFKSKGLHSRKVGVEVRKKKVFEL